MLVPKKKFIPVHLQQKRSRVYIFLSALVVVIDSEDAVDIAGIQWLRMADIHLSQGRKREDVHPHERIRSSWKQHAE